jgi:hypothetical protein
MSSFPLVAPAFLEEMVAYLLHLFIRGAAGDEAATRHAVLSTLAAYDAKDEQELRLAAEIISFGFATLEALAKSMDPDLPLNAVLRLRGTANAAHRSGHQCQRTLDKLRKERRTAGVHPPVPEIPARSGRLTRSAQRKPTGAKSADSTASAVAAATPGPGTQGAEGAAERGRTRSIGRQDRGPNLIFADQRDAFVLESSRPTAGLIPSTQGRHRVR